MQHSNLPYNLYVTIEDVSDEAILREADQRGLHLGITTQQLQDLVVAVQHDDWVGVRKQVQRLALDNLGRVI